MPSVDFALTPRHNYKRFVTADGSAQLVDCREVVGSKPDLHKSLKVTLVVTLLYVLFVVFGFPFASSVVFILHISYTLILYVRKELSHSDWLLFINLTLLGLIVYCFGSTRRKFSSEQRSGHTTEIANYSSCRLNYS